MGERDETDAAAQELAGLLAEALAARARGQAPRREPERLRALIAALADDEGGAETLLRSLSTQLGARGLRLPEVDPASPELAPLLGALGAALDPDPQGQVDPEIAAGRLDALLGELLGSSPRQRRAGRQSASIHEAVGASLAEALRRNGLRPERDGAPAADDDDFWSLIELAQADRAGFDARLDALPASRLAAFYWEYAAAKSEWQTAVGFAGEAGDRAAAAVVAQGYAFHAEAVQRRERGFAGNQASDADLGAAAAQIYGRRFGGDIRFAG